MKTLGIIALGFILTLLALAVWQGTQSKDCEALYNEFTNTVSMSDRAAIFDRGINNGCFHYN